MSFVPPRTPDNIPELDDEDRYPSESDRRIGEALRKHRELDQYRIRDDVLRPEEQDDGA